MSVLSESRSPADESGGEAQRKLLPNFAIGVGHHMARVGVDADQAGDFDVESGFPPSLHAPRYRRSIRPVPSLLPAMPQVVVAASDQHDALLVIGHDSGGGGHDTVGGGRGSTRGDDLEAGGEVAWAITPYSRVELQAAETVSPPPQAAAADARRQPPRSAAQSCS
jgi:hypothetical protein